MQQHIELPCIGYTARPGDGLPIPVFELDEYFHTAEGANLHEKTRRLPNGAALYGEAKHLHYFLKYGKEYADRKCLRNLIDERNAPLRVREDSKMSDQNDLTVFQHTTFGEVRTVRKDGEPWFVAADVCRALEVANPSQAVDRLDEDERAMFNIGRQGDTNIINEPGLYSLVLGSRKPEAKAFKRWITHEVIPSIRQTGMYATAPVRADLETMRAQAQQDRARAMLLNAQNRTLKTLMATVGDKALSPIAVEVFGLKSIEQITGVDMGSLLPVHERTYTATEVGERYGVSANKVGSIANKNGLKTDDYGVYVMDKSRHSNKEVPSFRYNQRGVERIGELLSGGMN